MNSINISKLMVACFVFLCFAPLTHAENTTPNATAMTHNTGFYTVNYSFTTDAYELRVPMFTERTIENSSADEVGYTFTTSEGGDSTAGETAGLVFSNQPSKNGMYHIPPHTTASFTLLVILKLDEQDPRAKYGLQVTNFPFLVTRNQVTHTEKVATLGAFKTKQIGLNK
jgi:hypothetical protein